MTQGLARTEASGATGGVDPYCEDFDRSFALLPGNELAWLRALRRGAMDRFAQIGFPTTRDEAWKYTSLAPLTRIAFSRVGLNGVAATTGALDRVELPFRSAAFPRLIFVDGRFLPERSQIGSLPRPVRAHGLREALATHPSLVEEHLGHSADYREQSLTALNTSFFGDGAFIHVPDGVVVETPIHLVFVSTRGQQPTVNHPRNLIVTGRAASLVVIEHYMTAPGVPGGSVPSRGPSAPGPGATFTNAVTELEVGEGATVAHYAIKEESASSSYHIGSLDARQGRSSSLTSYSLSSGARLGRTEIRSILDGEGASCALNGLYLAKDGQHVDHHTLVDHAEPHCSSQELFKGILGGTARGVFTGRVIVRKDAQKTNAQQTNRNLLLSDDARAETRPQLEIHANDVKCTHGAAIGRLDEEMVFYLRSRGIAENDARSLLTYAFANEVLGRIGVDAVRTGLEHSLATWLDGSGGSES